MSSQLRAESSASPRPSRPRPPLDARRARWAVSLIFFLNGASFCAILPRYPELVDAIGLTNGSFGLAVGLGPLGGLLAGLACAPLMARFGTARVCVIAQIIASTMHLLVYTAQSWLWLAAALMLATAADAITDIAMNGHGMRVERRYRRSIMNSYHGWWSLGAVFGGLLGASGAQLGVPLWAQGVAGVLVFGAAAACSYRFMLPGPDSTERRPAGEDVPMTAGVSPASGDDAPVPSTARPARAPRITGRALGLIACLGLVLVFTGAIEDAGNTWGALFMRSTFDAAPFLAGLAFVALQGAQTIGRFTGDAVVDRLGDRATARIGSVLAGAGMLLALLLPHPVTALLGFALAGWGIATLFPAAFRAADDMEGIAPGLGITLVGWVARLGFLASPPIVGAIADLFTLRWALLLIPLSALGILVVGGVLEGPSPHGGDRFGHQPAHAD